MALNGIKITNNFAQTQKEFDLMIKHMNDIVKTPINITVNISEIKRQFGEVKQQAEQLKTKMGNPIFKNSSFSNSFLDNQTYNQIMERIDNIRENVDSLAKVQVKMGVDSKGVEQIQSAIITYKNDLNQVVTETMGWVEIQKKVNDEIIKTPVFKTKGINYSDDIAKEESDLEKLNSDIEKFSMSSSESIQKLKGQFGEIVNTSEINTKISELQNKIDSLKLNPSQSGLEQLKTEFKSLSDEMNNIGGLDKVSQSIEKFTNSMQTNIDRLKVKYKELVPSTEVAEIESSMARLKSSEDKSANDIGKDIDSIKLKYQQMVTEIKASGSQLGQKDTMGWFDQLAHDAKQMALWTISGTAIFGTIHSIQDALSTVKELDDTINDLKMDMMSTSQTAFDGLVQSSRNLSIALGSNISDIDEMMKVYANANITVDEIMKKTKPAAILTNITDMSATESVDAIQSIMLQFDQFKKSSDDVATQATHVTDVLASVGQSLNVNFKTGVSSISEAIKVSGEVINEAGISYEKYASIVGKVAEVQRISGSTIGNAMKTIASRISRANSGDASDEDISKADKAYKSIGIDIRDATGNFKDLDSTLNSLSTVWGNLNSVQKSYIAEQSAGVRQKSIFITMMDNYATSTKMATDAINSQGLAEAKNNIYLDSISAKLKVLGNEITTMWQKGINSSAIKGLLDGATSLVKVFGNLHTIVSLVVTGLLLFKGADILKFFTSLPSKITTAVTSMSLYKNIATAVEMQQAGMITMNQAVSASFFALGTSIKTAFLSNPLGWIAIGITAVISVLDIFNQKQKETEQKAQEAQQKLQEEAQGLQDLKSQYTDIIKSGDLTEASKSQLKSIQDQLIKSYGLEADALDLVNGKYEDQVKVLNDVIAKKEKDAMNSMESKADEAKNTLYNSTDTKITSRSGMNALNSSQQVSDIVNSTFDSLNLESYGFVLTGNLQERIDKLNKAIDAIRDIPNKTKDTQEFLNSLSDELAVLNGQMKESQDTLSTYNQYKTDVDFFNQFGNEIAKTDELLQKFNKTTDAGDKSDVTKQLSDLKDGMIKAAESTGKLTEYQPLIDNLFSKISDGSNNASDGLNNLNGSADQSARALQQLQDAFQASTTKMEFYNNALDELNDKHKLSGTTVKSIFKDYPELLGYIGNETQLRQKLVDLIAQEGSTQKQVYADMMMSSEDFYNANIKGNATLVNDLKDKYQIDLNNYKNLAEAKSEVESKLLADLSNKWGTYFDAVNKSINKSLLSSDDVGASHAMQVQIEADPNYQRLQEAENYFKNIVGKFTPANFNTVNLSGVTDNSASKAAEDAAKKAEEARDAMKQNVEDVEQAITDIIKKEFEKRKQAIEDEYDARKTALQKEKDLYDKQSEDDTYQKNLKKEQETLNGINAQIVNGQRDSSLQGQSRLRDLLEQAKEQQDKIDEMILDHTKQANDARFDQEIQNLDTQKQSALDALDKQFSNENISKMVNEAMTTGQIKGIGDVLTAYQNFQNTYNDGLMASGKLLDEQFIQKWQEVQKLINGTAGVSIGVDIKALPVPSYDVGTSYIPNDQYAKVHAGEAILPKAYNIFTQNGLRNFINLVKPISIPAINKSNGTSVNFNEPFLVIQGGINSEIDLNKVIDTATEKVTSRIKSVLTDGAVYSH